MNRTSHSASRWAAPHRRHVLASLAIQGIVLAMTLMLPLNAKGVEGYYRQPAIHEDTIAFVAEGDIWLVDAEGGQARRLTTHPGDETDPCISPDGTTLAFAARYEGPTEVYTMPLAGGHPVRRTFEPEASIPVGWTHGGKLIYVTQHYSTLPVAQLIILDLASGRLQRVPLNQASDAAINPQGTIFFTRPRFHRQEVKRYEGGWARNIWRFASDAQEAVNLTASTPRECHSPMCWEGRVYFVTDRDGTMNIWSMSEDGQDPKQHTFHSGMDVRSANQGQGRIVYQLGADIWRLDVDTSVHRSLPIRLVTDLDQLREKWVVDPLRELSSVHVHPNGKSVVLTSRGRVFVAPAKDGRLVRVSRAKGVRYRDVTFMPNGQELLGLSDQTGEFEYWLLSARGVDPPRQLTSDGDILRWRAEPSPDGERVVYSDKNNDLWVLERATGARTKISHHREGLLDVAWSPDSRWIVFCEQALNTFLQLYLYHVDDGSTHALTSDRVNSRSPAWSPDGKWIYFLSDRNLVSVVSSPWGPYQPEPYFDEPSNIYRLALRSDLRSPFQPADELHESTPEEPPSEDEPSQTSGAATLEGDDTPAADGETEVEPSEAKASHQNAPDSDRRPPAIEVELDGIQRRIKPLPVDPGRYAGLQANDKALYWLQAEPGESRVSQLMALECRRESKPVAITADVRSFEISGDGKQLMIHKADGIFVVPAVAKSADLSKARVDLSAWSYSIDVREDWRQIFVDAWRLHRDYFYDPNMHGVNWAAMREKYAPLVERVTTRDELNDVIGQMVGELSTLHTAVRGGDQRSGPDDVKLPTLGARLVRDENAGGYRVEYIYKSDPDYPDELSPLADPDLQVAEGDVIEAINGRPVLEVMHPHELLRNQVRQQVLLRVRSPGKDASRELIVTPRDDEAELRYRDWEYTRRLQVEEQSGGKIGYVHLKNMGGPNITEWYRNFYPVFNRQGLIIDVRHNHGGNIDSLILEKLLRRAWFYWKGRVGQPTWNMQYAFRGHMVVLCNEETASDGEAFAEGFRRLGLGKVIGTRTWGGEIWLSASNRLSDGGIATAAELGVYCPEGEWLIEGHGVDPDLVVDNLPHATFLGGDAQLDAAVHHLLEAIEQDPRDVPPPPKYPVKAFDYP